MDDLKMFQKFAIAHGFDKRHFFVQCGFRKITGANFNAMDIRLFIEHHLIGIINTWICLYNISCVPYIKLEFARHPSAFTGRFMDIVTDLDDVTIKNLMFMKDHRPYPQIYIRLYYK